LALRKKNYLNNADLLVEIHKSKTSYCSFIDTNDADFDIILPSVEKINRNTIAQAKQNRAIHIAKKQWQESLARGEKTKLDQFAIDPKSIDSTELVFRINTFDHIPKDPTRKKKPKNPQDHYVKLNFPPFQHYRLNKEGEAYCVGKSHWVGGLQNGHFSKDHGSMTTKLGRMFIKLCERYGSKWNWRNYSYNDEMRAQALLQLSQVGLQFDESKSQNPFAYYTATINNSFTRILNLEKRNQFIRDNILEMEGYNPSSTRQYENYEKSKID
jgi:hypothetical protein